MEFLTGIPRYTAFETIDIQLLHTLKASLNTSLKRPIMEMRVSYEHSLSSSPNEFIVQVPSQLVCDVPASVPRALLPEYIASLITERSPTIGKIRNLRIL